MQNTIWLNDGNFTILGRAALNLANTYRDRLNLLRRVKTNKAFVYDQDGTMRAAQSTEEGAMEYMTPDRILVLQ